MCTITGTKRYSADLKQGGKEIPYVLTFERSIYRTPRKQNSWSDLLKAEKLVSIL
jgi:hypothetical protein